MVVRAEIQRLLQEAIARAQTQGLLPQLTVQDIPVDPPARPEHGDYASSIALRLKRTVPDKSPLEIADILVRALPESDLLATAEVAPPGFINFRLADAWLARQVDEINRAGRNFGRVSLGRGERVQVEYVSANPTGPLTHGHGRGAALGDVLANLLDAAGYQVQREYYINDYGDQVEILGETLYARYCQLLGQDVPLPPNAYQGSYVIDWAHEVIAQEGDRYLHLPREEAVQALQRIGIEKALADIRQDLDRMGIRFDCWYTQSSLLESSRVAKTIEDLRARGFVAEREGAVWFTSKGLGDDKENVLIRSNGSPTYFAADIAYHRNKFVERGFDRVIDVWGADHHGHVPRMKAAMAALGIDPNRLEFVLVQMVSLRRGSEIVRASKRTGNYVTLREVLDEVGPDVCRFYYISRSADSQMDFDLEQAKKESLDNPVYYLQYGHARIAGILRKARARGITWEEGDVTLLQHPAELALIRKMLLFPEVVADAARKREPHRLPHYARELADSFHSFYEQCRVLPGSGEAVTPLSQARLKLVQAAQTTLANALALMGVSAPERMTRAEMAEEE
jgi:arginyl-tRNA synthetase